MLIGIRQIRGPDLLSLGVARKHDTASPRGPRLCHVLGLTTIKFFLMVNMLFGMIEDKYAHIAIKRKKYSVSDYFCRVTIGDSS